MVFVLPSLLLALTATLVGAQNNQNSNNQNSTYVSGLIQALNNAGLTTLASAVGVVNSTNVGGQLLSNLSNQSKNYTVFAPNNDACTSHSLFCPPTPLGSILTFTCSQQHPRRCYSRSQLSDRYRRISRCVWSLQ